MKGRINVSDSKQNYAVIAGVTMYQINDCSMTLNGGLLLAKCMNYKLGLHGHVAHFPEVDLVHRVILIKGNLERRRIRGHPQD